MQELNNFAALNQHRHISFLEAKSLIDVKISKLHETVPCHSTTSRHPKTSYRLLRSYPQQLQLSLRSCSQQSLLRSQLIIANIEAKVAMVIALRGKQILKWMLQEKKAGMQA